jgi:ELWxxDGT repeat protein
MRRSSFVLFVAPLVTVLLALANSTVAAIPSEALAPDPPVKAPFQVKAINPLTHQGSYPSSFIEVNGIAYFIAYSPGQGREMWRSDGTEQGTYLVKEIGPGSASSYAGERWVVLNDLIITGADDGIHGFELWRSDGTEQGTVLIRDLNPGPADGVHTSFMTVSGNHVYFGGNSTSSGNYVLYRSDGYTIERVLDETVFDITVAANQLFFEASYQDAGCAVLWRYDGSVVEPVQALQGGSTGPICSFGATAAGEKLFFFRDQLRTELWVTDGTDAGTRLVTTMVIHHQDGYPLYGHQGMLFFPVVDPASGNVELWRSDGTAQGTLRLLRFAVSGGNAGLYNFTSYGNNLYFMLADTIAARWLWRTDGTPAGTVAVYSFAPGYVHHWNNPLAVVGEHLYIGSTGMPATGTTLWQSDGTSAGTIPLYSRPADAGIDHLAGAGDWLFLSWGEPWAWHLTSSPPTDITLANLSIGTHLAAGTIVGPVTVQDPDSTDMHRIDLVSGPGDTHNSLFEVDNSVLRAAVTFYDAAALKQFSIRLRADDGKGGTVEKSFTVDAQPQGNPLPDLYPVREVSPTRGGVDAQPHVHTTTHVFYAASYESEDGSPVEAIWASDGTEAGTQQLMSVQSRWSGDAAALNNIAYFSARTAGAGVELWRSDGTPEGTWLVRDILPGTGSSNPTWLTAAGGTVYFAATGSEGSRLWKSDGTEAGTVPVAAPAPGGPFAAVGETLFFIVQAGGNQLWRTDGTAQGTALVQQFGAFPIGDLTATEDLVYFTVSNPAPGQGPIALYRSDGTTGGTMMLPGTAPRLLTPSGGSLYYRAGLNELWRTGGTTGTTARAGIAGSEIVQIVDAARNLYISSETANGTRLFHLDASGSITQIPGAAPEGGEMAAAGRYLFFTQGAQEDATLWRTDATLAGTVPLPDLMPGPASPEPDGLLGWNNSLFFGAQNLVSGRQLWAYRGAGEGTVGPQGGTLPVGAGIFLDIPPAALSASTTFRFDPLMSLSRRPPRGLSFAGVAFTLEATQEGQPITNPSSGISIQLTVAFDSPVERSEPVHLFSYDPALGWRNAASSCARPSTDERGARFLRVDICHLTEFALFHGEQVPEDIYLPMIGR